MTLFDGWSKAPEQRELCAFTTQRGVRSGPSRPASARAAAWRSPRWRERRNCRATASSAAAIIWRRRGAASLICSSTIRAIWTMAARISSMIIAPCWPPANCTRPVASRCSPMPPTAARAHVGAAGRGWPFLDGRAAAAELFSRGRGRLALSGLVALRRGIAGIAAGERRAPVGAAWLAGRDGIDGGAGQSLRLPAAVGGGGRRGGRGAFFMPQRNGSGYWWQGENARLASLAAAASGLAALEDQKAGSCRLTPRARWTGFWGAIPSMSACWGWGRNNPRYEPGYYNACGGCAMASPPRRARTRASPS